MSVFNEEKAIEGWKATGLTNAEIQPLLSFTDRVKFAELYLKDGNKPWHVWEHQKDCLNWYGKRKVNRSGRSTGKTKDLEVNAIQACIMEPNEEQLIGTQREQHIEPLMERIIKLIEGSDLRTLLKKKPQRSPDYKLEFKNGHILWGRIGGPNGQNFQGMHVKYQRVEEAQEWTNKSWLEFLPGLNDGGYRYIYGVPNGVRNRFHEFCHDPEYQLYTWNRENNPGTTEKDIIEWTKMYGGKKSADYLHYVRGIDGTQRFATFDYDDYLACVAPDMKFIEASFDKESLKKQSVKQCLNSVLRQAAALFEGAYCMGIDVGWTTDPTEITLWVDDNKFFANFLRIKLENWKLPEQQEAVQYIDEFFPLTSLGIDRGGIGLGLQQGLSAIDTRWAYITQGFHWGQNVTVGLTAEGQPDNREAKTHSVLLIEKGMKDKTMVLPYCKTREDQYINMTHEVRKQTGQIVYSEHNAHLVNSDMCAILANKLQKTIMANTEPDYGVDIRPLAIIGSSYAGGNQSYV